MKKFLRHHTNTLLGFLALLFSALIIGYFAWGIGYIIFEVNIANRSETTKATPPEFDLNTAATLDYRGVLPVASS